MSRSAAGYGRVVRAPSDCRRGGGGGIAFPAGSHFATLGVRYRHGFTNHSSDDSVKNRVLSFFAAFEFTRNRLGVAAMGSGMGSEFNSDPNLRAGVRVEP